MVRFLWLIRLESFVVTSKCQGDVGKWRLLPNDSLIFVCMIKLDNMCHIVISRSVIGKMGLITYSRYSLVAYNAERSTLSDSLRFWIACVPFSSSLKSLCEWTLVLSKALSSGHIIRRAISALNL